MAANVVFSTTGESWNVNNGRFDILMALVYDKYLPKTENPTISEALLGILRVFLYECWPERYQDVSGHNDRVIVIDSFPVLEQEALLSAINFAKRDFENDSVDTGILYNRTNRDSIVQSVTSLEGMMRRAIDHQMNRK